MDEQDCEFCGSSDSYINSDYSHWVCRECDDEYEYKDEDYCDEE